jgi:hypothetical protein
MTPATGTIHAAMTKMLQARRPLLGNISAFNREHAGGAAAHCGGAELSGPLISVPLPPIVLFTGV